MSDSRFIEANGVRLHYLDHDGEGPVLVLTHGLTANAHFFDELVHAGLAPALRVLSFDLRGRGLSEKPERGYSLEDHAADLLGALDVLGIERVALGGHSFGGLLTLYVAAFAPESVERALVLDAPAEVDATVLEQIGPSLARLDRTYPSRGAYLEFVRGLPYFANDGWNDSLAAFYDAELEELPEGTVRSGCRPEHIRQTVEGMLEHDWPAIAARVECPTLLLRTTDPFGPPGSAPIMSQDGARRTLARLRRGRLVEVPGNHITFAFGAHAPRVVDELRSFVRDRVAS
ncbi:MAG TPA: alpha/beta hydrolase [Gaiellaceae bacterium]|nr:alpha/beta hydrolase [Gaiellaceae bacterium]